MKILGYCKIFKDAETRKVQWFSYIIYKKIYRKWRYWVLCVKTILEGLKYKKRDNRNCLRIFAKIEKFFFEFGRLVL